MQAGAFFILGFHRGKLVGPRRRVVDKLGEKHSPDGCERTPSQYKCSVEGWPWRMDFSRADAALMASSGSDVSISFFFTVVMSVFLRDHQVAEQ